MGSLFAELARRAANSARREVEAYAREIPEFASLDADARARAETMEYAVWLRRRTLELSPDNSPLTPDDLAFVSAMGEVRGGSGMSLESRQRVLCLHTALMLREIHEAVDAKRGGDAEELLRMMGWFAPQGERGISAYCQGFVTALRRRLPYVEQVALLAKSLLTQDPLAAELAPAVGMELPEHCAVTVVRIPDGSSGHDGRGGPEREIEALMKTHRVPMVWCPTGDGGGELIALVPDVATRPRSRDVTDHASASTSGRTPAAAASPATAREPGPPAEPAADSASDLGLDPVPDLALDLVRDFAGALDRPCAAGTASAPLTELACALNRARRISRVTPLRRAPARLRPLTTADAFVELAVADVPFVDSWLATVARHLEPGPDLVVTLDAYYRYDMDRGAAAAALNVHPRTLDYRLRRVRELTGLAPGSTRGVRVLSAAVARRLAVR
ncbi:PucR family transcriptional regulator [Streptomyces sp. NRRL B-1347]|uniref:PucR family transcriptional regulator n=1 Tax=Streptomyces sp. NRRL B-1347 TaxID=1476877 RepID=UPI0004CC7CF9|nr:PucR family transcriptional regulator [Streptomyces sp. NRRL B-1347]